MSAERECEMRRFHEVRTVALGLLAAMLCLQTARGAGIEGRWMTVSDKTGKPESIVRLVEHEGELRGTIEEIFPAPGDPPNPRCEKCKGEFKDKPIVGLQFLWGFRRDGDRYGPGRILDPDEGEVYRCELALADDGRALKVRGYIGIPLFGRTQVWVRRP